MSTDTLYFAYGSNLAVNRRGIRSRALSDPRVARLRDYRLAFNVRGTSGEVYANILPVVGDEVWGVVYRCTAAAMADLDKYEELDVGMYLRAQVDVKTTDGELLSAEVYWGGPRFLTEPSTPRPDYLAVILSGARAHGLPAQYIAGIETVARGSTGPA